jgi:hypothetical protein
MAYRGEGAPAVLQARGSILLAVVDVGLRQRIDGAPAAMAS